MSTHANPPAELQRDYVFVDWGPEFFAQHALAFPDFTGATLTVNIGWLGLQRILAFGGSGFFPARMLRDHEAAGILHRVPGAPEFRLPAYLCFSEQAERSEPLALALDTIRRVAAEAA